MCKKIDIRDSKAVLWQRKSYKKKKQINDQWLCSQAIINTCKLCCISTTAKNNGLLLSLFHSLEVHFMNSYNNNQMFVGPLSIKMKHLSLSRALKT